MLGLKVATFFAAVASLAVAAPTYKSDNDNSCGRGMFWWGPKSCCLPHGGHPHPPSPPKYSVCQKGWYWHNSLNFCAPPEPQNPNPGCSSGYKWDETSYSCQQPPPPPPPAPAPGPGKGGCGGSQFYWEPKKCCLPTGGPPSPPPAPPSGYSCPENWYFRESTHCAPKQLYTGNPSCGQGYSWYADSLRCKSNSY